MQGTFIQTGSTIDYTPSGADVAAGQVVVQNNSVGVAKHKILDGELGALTTEGVFDFVHDAVAKAAGESVYWDADGDPVGGTAGTGALTKTSSGNTYVGKVVSAAANTDTSCRVRLVDAASVTNNQYGPMQENEITDPGDAGAIPVTATGYCDLVTADAETRTLAIPTFDAQQIRLNLKTDGGDCVVTVASAVNATGNNTLTFADASDVCILHAVDNSGTMAWRIIANDGVALSTV